MFFAASHAFCYRTQRISRLLGPGNAEMRRSAHFQHFNQKVRFELKCEKMLNFIDVYHTLPTLTGRGGLGGCPPSRRGIICNSTFRFPPLQNIKRPAARGGWQAQATRTARDFWLRSSASPSEIPQNP